MLEQWYSVFLLEECGLYTSTLRSVESWRNKGGLVNYVDPVTGQTPLMRALSVGKLEIVSMLLDSGAITEHADVWGNTWTHYLNIAPIDKHTKKNLSLLIQKFSK